jgi:glycopeptide antibiotics resistance protein
MSPRVIVISRRGTIVLLIAVTVAIAALTLALTGKSYSKVDPIPFEDLRHLYQRVQHRPIATHIMMLIVAPAFLNLCLFAPWGFLMFLALARPERPAVTVYVLTVLLGLTFSCAIEACQYFLPTRVADVNDIIWNSTGTAVGAIAGHFRRRLRFEFD